MAKDTRSMYSQGPQGFIWPDIIEKMKQTFFYRHKKCKKQMKKPKHLQTVNNSKCETEREEAMQAEIETETLVEYLTQNYPFFFTISCMAAHCRMMLTDRKDL